MADDNLSPTSRRAGANIQRSADRVKVMIDDLFAFTRTRLGDTLPLVLKFVNSASHVQDSC
jgi:hypothetical protein